MIDYAIETTVDPADVIALFRASGIRRPVDEPERIARMIEHANLIVTARENGRLVGIARALTDFSFCCYLSDLAVDDSVQRQGIGRELVRRVEEAIGDDSMLLLLAAPAAAEYYPHIGFEAAGNAWILHRKR